VVRAGAELWRQLKQWSTERRVLSQKEIEIIDVAASMPRMIPSEKQSLVIMKALGKLRAEGCTLGADVI
jgi:DNA gyrase inhibitor GyrI